MKAFGNPIVFCNPHILTISSLHSCNVLPHVDKCLNSVCFNCLTIPVNIGRNRWHCLAVQWRLVNKRSSRCLTWYICLMAGFDAKYSSRFCIRFSDKLSGNWWSTPSDAIDFRFLITSSNRSKISFVSSDKFG